MIHRKNFTPVDPDKIGSDSLAGKISKEHELSGNTKRDAFKITETVEQESPEEIKQFMQSRQENVTITPDLQKVGMKKTEETPRYIRKKTIVLPLADDMVEKGLHAPITSSLRWLAEWSVFLLKKAHLVLKKVHGHVKRIIQ